MNSNVKIEPKFKVGDCVQLSSGGYKMTITHLRTRPVMGGPLYPTTFTGYVECNWFEDNPIQPNLHKNVFPQDALISCKPEAS